MSVVQPQAPNVINPSATIIQQLGLHTGEGLQRLCMLLVNRLDPQGHGILVTEKDVQEFAAVLTNEGRRHMAVVGMGNTGFVLKLVGDDTGKALAEAAERSQKA
jgi:hypothetical protein